jgi:hypothetical protein
VNEAAAACVDSATVAEAEDNDRVTALLGGGLLSERLRGGHEFVPAFSEDGEGKGRIDVSLGPATQIEFEDGQVRFLVPFTREWPNEYWLRAFRQAQLVWPSHLVQPRIDEGRGLQFGPFSVAELEEHVRAAKDQVAAGNRIYAEEVEPELRRQREEAFRRDEEERRLQAEVETKLRLLLG